MRCNRILADPKAKYGWRCAEILGVATSLNRAGDNANRAFLQGIIEAENFLSDYGVDRSKVNLFALYSAFVKQSLATGLSSPEFLELANQDIINALMQQTSASPSIDVYIAAKDANDVEKNNYSASDTALVANGIIDKTTSERKGKDAIFDIVSMAAAIGISVIAIFEIIAAVGSMSVATTPIGGIITAIASMEGFTFATTVAAYNFATLITAIIYYLQDGGFNSTLISIRDTELPFNGILGFPIIEPLDK